MASLYELYKKAENAAAWRDHRLAWDAPAIVSGRWIQRATCTRCDAWVQIDTGPPANGIDIGGPAVALNCGDSE